MIQYLCQLQSTNLEASIGISIDYTNLQSYAKKHPDFVLSAKAKYFNTFTLISLGDSRRMLIQFFWWEVLTAWNTVLVGNVERNEWCSRDSFQIEWMWGHWEGCGLFRFTKIYCVSEWSKIGRFLNMPLDRTTVGKVAGPKESNQPRFFTRRMRHRIKWAGGT